MTHWKRILGFLLAAVMVLSCLGCNSQEQEEFQDPVNFYYIRQSADTASHEAMDSVIVPLVREGFGIRSNLSVLLNMYLADPGTEEFPSPFPAGTYIISVRNDGDLLEITLTDSIATLTGLDLTLACACLAHTVIELTGTHGIRVCAENKSLDGQPSITMNMNTLHLIDVATYPTESVDEP